MSYKFASALESAEIGICEFALNSLGQPCSHSGAMGCVRLRLRLTQDRNTQIDSDWSSPVNVNIITELHADIISNTRHIRQVYLTITVTVSHTRLRRANYFAAPTGARSFKMSDRRERL